MPDLDEQPAADVARCPRCGSAARPPHTCTTRTTAPAWVAPAVYGPLPTSERPRHFDPVAHTWSAAEDLERLAAPRWLRHFYGRAIALEGGTPGTGERVLPLDDATAHERERVTAIHARLEALRVGPGCLHYAVLVHVFLEHGPGQRMPGASALAAGAGVADAFLEELGWTFASPAQRVAWREQRKSVRRSLPLQHGRRLYRDAVAAYERPA